MESKTRLYLIIFLAFYFLAVSMIITGAVIPQWMDEFSVSAGRAGRLFAFYYLPYTIVTFCSGLLSQRWGKKVVLLLGQAFLAGGFFSVSTSPSFSLIEWGLFLMGVGGGFSEAPFTLFFLKYSREKKVMLLIYPRFLLVWGQPLLHFWLGFY